MADDTASPTFPYDRYRNTELWQTVEKAIHDLVENHDIAETTRQEYIVGYICKRLEKL
ncbi:MAG TPA: hypothetical protein VN776_13830 [Terracidiphilus sp.]|nr:hypothetical protein [Terracidiphilus sp.]